MKETRFDQAKRAATFQMRTSTTMTQDQALPGPTHDGLSALTAMRTLNFAPGASSSFAVSDSGYLYRVTLNVGAKETITTGLGSAAGVEGRAGDSRRQGAGRRAAASPCGFPTTRVVCRCASRRSCRSGPSC